MIIYAWQQLEGIKENVLKLKTSGRSGARRIQLGDVKFYRSGGARILPSARTQILNSPARQTERLYNCMPKELREITGVTVDTFKKHLDKWLMEKVPDKPRCEVLKIMMYASFQARDWGVPPPRIIATLLRS